MIVSGVPVKTTTHAQPVANFALDMVCEASRVNSPATGQPLQVSSKTVSLYVITLTRPHNLNPLLHHFHKVTLKDPKLDESILYHVFLVTGSEMDKLT